MHTETIVGLNGIISDPHDHIRFTADCLDLSKSK